MRQLSPDGQRIASDLSARHGFSVDAVIHMMLSVLHGNGSLAQFSHGEFGGSGQWMRGGMIMLGDMFNNYLKGRVDNLCSEIANILATQPGLLQSGSFQSQSQGGSSYQHQTTGGGMGSSSLFVPDPEDNWWPSELGRPAALGSQNNVRYAYFSNSRRLAIKTGGEVWVYDTQDHQIGGFSQQQGYGGSILLSSQYGTVDIARLPVVSRNGQTAFREPTPAPPETSYSQSAPGVTTNDVLAALERLGDLKAKGVLTDAEFSAKKADLLSRL